MTKRILLRKATRIEGNADIHIEVQNGRVAAARFMVQDFRGFEKLTQGKVVESAPHILSRICGLCSISHQVAGLRAVEDALAVQVPDSVHRLRQIGVWGEWIASHALSYFFLTLPDILGVDRGVFDLMQAHPEVARDAFFLRRSGNRIAEIVGKRAVHAVSLGVGRLNVALTRGELDEIRSIASEVRETTGRLIGELGDRHEREVRIPFPSGHNTNFLSYDARPDQRRFKAFDRMGEVKVAFDRESFGAHISEMRTDWSLAKFPYLTDLGFPDGILFVGPLSRLFLTGGVLDDPRLSDLALSHRLRDPDTLFLDHLDECRLLEICWAAQQILSYSDEIDLAQLTPDKADLSGSGWGIGVVEAPRGVLVHTYAVSRGVLERVRLLVATQFNNAYINLVLRGLAEQHVNGDGLSIEGEELVARCIRVFDPCLTCATH